MSNKRDDLEFSFERTKGDDEIRFELDDETSQLLELIKQLEQKKEAEAYAGWKRWFVPGTPYGIEKLPKHAAFLFAGKNNHETYFSAANRCFAEGTLVATPRGPVAIESLKIGDEVYDRYRQPTRVLNVIANGEREVYDVVNHDAYFGRVVWATCTPDHEFDCSIPTYEGFGQEIRVQAKDLKTKNARVRAWIDEFKHEYVWDVEMDVSTKRLAKVYDITVAHDEHFFLLANGLSVSNCGKSLSGAFQTALHLLGDYPEWWEGKTWDRPTDGWAVGDSKETVRDIIQKELLGDVGRLGTGMIPSDRIEKVVYRPNSGGAVDYVLVRHKSGGLSRLGFKSSEQGIQSFYGTAKDFVWLDELPAADIYSECFLRTMTTNGIIYVTATPLAGLTPLVLNFYNTGTFLPEGSELPGIVKLSREDDEESQKERLRKGEIDEIKRDTSSKAVIVAGWDDAPWLSEDAKRRMLDATPDHLKEARSKGLPSMGSGTIYTIPLEEVLVKDFDIPDHWKRICGMDVGWNNTAAIWLAENPDTKQVYAYSEYKRGNAEPVVHAAAIKNRGDWIPIAIDPASRGRSQVDGKQLFNLYRELGLKLFPADNAVEAGIYRVQEMLATGRLKFFRSLSELAKEYVVYRRNEKGKVIKEMDHLLDALRYAIVGVKHARQKPITNSFNEGGISTYGSRQYDI